MARCRASATTPRAATPLRHPCGTARAKRRAGAGRTTVGDYLEHAEQAGFSWPLPDDLTDEALEQRLFPSAEAGQGKARPQPDWPMIHRELHKPAVTLMLLWEEYRAVHPDGYGYSQFCELYRRFKGRLSPTMRQTHAAGERMFVDYAGQTIEIVDGLFVHDIVVGRWSRVSQPNSLGLESAIEPSHAVHRGRKSCASAPRTPRDVLRWVLDGIDIPFWRYAFIDIGWCRGRNMFGAAELPFALVCGVRYAKDAIDHDVEKPKPIRLRQMRADEVCFMTQDAMEIAHPDMDSIYFLSKICASELMRAIVNRVKRQAIANERTAIFVFQDFQAHELTPLVAGMHEVKLSWPSRLKLTLARPYRIAAYRLQLPH